MLFSKTTKQVVKKLLLLSISKSEPQLEISPSMVAKAFFKKRKEKKIVGC